MFGGQRNASELGPFVCPRFDACFAIPTVPVLHLKFRYGFCRPAGAAALHLASGLELRPLPCLDPNFRFGPRFAVAIGFRTNAVSAARQLAKTGFALADFAKLWRWRGC